MADIHDPGEPRDPRDRHADHDPEVVAALLDREADATEATDAARATATSWIATCADCATLHADLLALSTATRELPVPARPRDFRLTAADAARLAGAAGSATREPNPSSARLTGVMNDTRDHASHDTLLVASLADRSVADRERAAAEALVDTCGLCATLHADLVALSAATRTLPTPTRTRDYRLTPNDAVRLRPRGWRRLVAAFGSPRDAFSRPLAVGLTTLGLAGLLVATLPSILTGQAPAGAATTGAATTSDRLLQSESTKGGAEVASPPDDAVTAPGAASRAPLTDRNGAAALIPSAAAAAESSRDIVNTGAGENVDVTNGIDRMDDLFVQADDLQGQTDVTVAARPAGISTMLVVAGTLLIAGLGLFALRWSTRRFGRG